jgi:hypothetical protein
MGYFRRKLRRGVCLREKRNASREIPEPLRHWVTATPDPPPLYPATYIRLATSGINDKSGQRAGIFGAAFRLLRDRQLDPGERERLRKALRWFQMYLHSPRLGKRKAVFWFRSDAGRFVNRLWKIVEILRRHGVMVRMLLTSDPGAIVYKDRHQVAAVPMGSHLNAATPVDIP